MSEIARAVMTSVAVLAALPVGAQEPRPERPYRGVFAGGVGDTEHLLVATGAAGGGYDSNVVIDQRGVESGSAPLPTIGSRYTAVSGGLAYSLTRTKVSFAASGSTGANYYFDLSDPLVYGHSGNVGASFEVSRRTRVSGNQSVSYQPLSSFGLFPALGDPGLGQAAPIDASFGAIGELYLHSGSYATVSQTLSSRASLLLSYARTLSNFASDDLDVTTQEVRGTFLRNIARGLNLRFGYGYGTGDYVSGEDAEEDAPHGHTIDAGIDFDRALSLSRRTTLSFATGSTAVKQFEDTRYYVTGNARLRREIGRTWEAALAYNRGVEFVDTLREPVFSDSLNFGLSGLITRRLEFHSNAGTAFGNVGFSDSDSGFRSYYGTSGLSFALNRHAALAVEYYVYRYDFDDTAALLPGLQPELTRHSVRAYIDLWAPLFARARTRDASR
jgi:hypothetical protein